MPARIPRRPVRLAALAVALLAATAPVLGAPPPTRAALHAVAVLDGAFSPATLTISVGDSVTWTNDDDSPHTVTSSDGSFDSGNLDAGGFFTFTFTEPGTYSYVCAYHDEMQATIVVEAASAPAPAAPAATAAPTAATASGSGTDAAAHGVTGDGAQPDTALPLPGTPIAWLAPLLIGLGLVALAFGLVPVARPRPAAPARAGGWRR